MSQLTEAVKALDVRYEASDSEEWVRYECPHGGFRYVIRSRLADGYVAWCDTDNAPAPEWYLTAVDAINRAPEGQVRAPGVRGTSIGAPATLKTRVPATVNSDLKQEKEKVIWPKPIVSVPTRSERRPVPTNVLLSTSSGRS